jgi:multisubunit Na+/H+ antiporter MnhB subunit
MISIRSRPFVVLATAIFVTLLAVLLFYAISTLPSKSPGLTAQVNSNLVNSGVQAEVTAVLLNFRGYDTLLEVAVLLVAMMAVWYLGPLHLPGNMHGHEYVMDNLVRLLTPVMILVAGYILWLGGHTAGGAFQAGAVLAGAGILLRVARPEWLALYDTCSFRTLLVTGPAVFVLTAAGTMLFSRAMLEYPLAYAGSLILLIEMASTVSIAAMLTMLFVGGRPHSGAAD